MQRAKIKETMLDFGLLSERRKTDMIVVHHTGLNDIDASAAEIHDWHCAQGWSGIGYHYVVRKDGTIERGRPDWAVGSHAYGENSHTLGVHLSGDFERATPTSKQIEMVSMLIANVCADYRIPIDREHIVGHGELMATECPGKNLQRLLDDGTIVGKANWYRYTLTPESVARQVIEVRSGLPITDETLEKIKKIFDESRCPNESLLNSIENFTSYDGSKVVQLADGSTYERQIELK